MVDVGLWTQIFCGIPMSQCPGVVVYVYVSGSLVLLLRELLQSYKVASFTLHVDWEILARGIGIRACYCYRRVFSRPLLLTMSHSINTPDGEVLNSSAAGTTFLILIQLASRVFTFASNQLVLRALSPTVLGVAAQLELYQVSILYFSRESFRLAIQRQPLSTKSSPTIRDGKDEQQAKNSSITPSIPSQSVVNISYLSVFLGIPSALVFTLLYQHLAAEQTSAIPFFNASVAITGLAALMEISTEPFFAIIQQQMWYDKRAAVEMPAAFLKSLGTCLSFMLFSRMGYDFGALPFALGYLSYSITLICGYWLSLLPRAQERSFSYLLKTIATR